MKDFLLTLMAVFGFVTLQAQISVISTSTDVTCFGGTDGQIVLSVTGGTPPYQYTWSPTGINSPTLSGLPAGTYWVTVTDNASNVAIDTAVVLQPPQITVVSSVTDATCNNFDGRIIITVYNGVAPYTYTWSNGSTTANQMQVSAGTYTLTITDANGCTVTHSATVLSNNVLPLTTSVQYDSCQGTACILATAPPNSTYMWNTGMTTSLACGLPNGVYSLTVTGPTGCVATATVPIVNVTALQAAATSTPASCGSDGSVIATAANGTGPYSFVWNTTPPATTATVTNLPAGNYTVTVTDAAGCVTTASTVVASGSLSVGAVTVVPATCGGASNGSATVVVSGTNPPFTYTWSGGVGTANTVTGLSPGIYTVTITDAGGCILVQTITVGSGNLQIVTGMLAEANCLTGQAGALYVQVVNGQAPYTYAWSNNLTSDTITGLASGGYTVTVTDANGCSAVRHQFVTSSITCRAYISGRVYLDADTDCNYNSGNDFGISGALVSINNNNYTYTQANGVWSAYVVPGNYSIKVSNTGNISGLTDACGIDSIAVTVVDTTSITNKDFPKNTSIMNNVGVSLYCGPARPGFTQLLYITVNNLGFSAADGHGSFVLDAVYDSIYTYYTPAGFTVDSITSNPKTVHFSFTNLAPQQSSQITVYANVPLLGVINIGQTVSHSASVVLGNNTDQVLGNNSYTCSTIVTGSYDPNDKQVFDALGGSVDGPAAIEDTLLRYLIRFQNTGTDTAFNITVRDTIDEHLDLGTFRFIAASHDVNIEFYEGGIVHFVFNNILLPDSNVNEPGSHGFIEFDIEVKDKQALEEITNQAAIYFDFNPPIYTNTVATQRTVGIRETIKVPVHIFPNPTTGLLSVNIGGLPVEQVELYDLTGRKVLSSDYASIPQADLDASALQSGLYIVRIRSGAGWYMDKVVVGK